MKLKKVVSMIVIFTLVTTTILVGCNKSEDDKDLSQTKEQIEKEQYLNVAIDREPTSCDPSKAPDIYSGQVITEVFEGLTRVEQDKNGKDIVKPAGAKNWKVSDDGLTWTFYLRDYKWSDGKQVTAKDFEYGIKRTLDPKVKSPSAYLLNNIKNAENYNNGKVSVDKVGIKVLDNKTIQFNLNVPSAYFLNLTCLKNMMPQREDIIKKNKELYGKDEKTMVYCGPFKIKEWIHNNKIELVKNEKYWDSKSVKLNKITMKILKEEQSRMNELLNNSIDIASATKLEWTQEFNKTNNFDVIGGFEPTTTFLFFNQKIKLFNNDKVRKAFSIALDREDIVKTLYGGIDKPAYAWCPPSVQIGKEEFRDKVKSDPIKNLKNENPNPKELLVQGLKELEMDLDPSKITVKYLTTGTDGRRREIAEYYSQVYKKVLGINLDIEYVEWKDFIERTKNLNYELAARTWNADYNDPMSVFNFLITDSEMISTGWSNPKYDNLIKRAESLPADENEERVKLFKEAEKILIYDDAVIVPTTYKKRSIYKYKYVKGLMLPLCDAGKEFKYVYIDRRK